MIKIEFNTPAPRAAIREIQIGDAFMYQGQLYVLLDPDAEVQFSAALSLSELAAGNRLIKLLNKDLWVERAAVLISVTCKAE